MQPPNLFYFLYITCVICVVKLFFSCHVMSFLSIIYCINFHEGTYLQGHLALFKFSFFIFILTSKWLNILFCIVKTNTFVLFYPKMEWINELNWIELNWTWNCLDFKKQNKKLHAIQIKCSCKHHVYWVIIHYIKSRNWCPIHIQILNCNQFQIYIYEGVLFLESN